MLDIQIPGCFTGSETSPELFGVACCSNYRCHIPYKGLSSTYELYLFLPKSIISRARKGNKK